MTAAVSPARRRRLDVAFACLAAVGCVACCALPLLLDVGLVSGVGWAVTGRWLPVIAVLLIAAIGALEWAARRHRHQAGGSGGEDARAVWRNAADAAPP